MLGKSKLTGGREFGRRLPRKTGNAIEEKQMRKPDGELASMDIIFGAGGVGK